MSIQNYLDKIRTAVSGKDVRQSIHDAIKTAYDDASKEGNANMEVSMARGQFDTLDKRLTDSDNTLFTKASQSYVATVLQSAVSGSPKDFYYTLSALQSAYPQGTDGIFLVLENGHIYVWDGSMWADAGIYQERGLGKDSVTFEEASFIEKSDNLFNSKHPDVVRGYYLDHLGKTVANATLYKSHKISVKPGETFIMRIAYSSAGVFYTLDGTLIEKIGVETGSQLNYSFIAPPNASYMIVNGELANIDTDMIVTGSNYPSIFIPFKRMLSDDIKISEKSLAKDIVPYSNVIYPRKIYTVANDKANNVNSFYERHNSLSMFVDYLYNTKTDILFGNKQDCYPFLPIVNEKGITNNGVNVHEKAHTISFSSSQYSVPNITVKQVSTKASVVGAKKPFVLLIGDSQTFGYGSDQGQVPDNSLVYWGIARKLFAMEDIDYGNAGTHDALFLGMNNIRNIDINYKGVTKTIKACAEGRSGWSLHHYLRQISLRTPTQANWDLLGLGNGTGTDFKGTQLQKDLMSQTVENSYHSNPPNPFFDNDRTGNIKFSISKWLSRFRTMDDNGNRLVWGDSRIGTLVTQETLNTFDVTTPTHVVFQLGTNDFYYVSPSVFRQNVLDFIAELRSQLPNAHIIVSVAPPSLGTYFPERYPNYLNIPTPEQNGCWENAKHWTEYFANYAESTNKVFLLPTYFVTPTAEAVPVLEIDGGYKKQYIPYAESAPFVHPNSNANYNWGYQLYSLIKYTLSL